MSSPALELRSLLSSGQVRFGSAPAAPAPSTPSAFGMAELAGRLVELAGEAALTVAIGLVLEAQRRAEPVAWITQPASSFYPPDAAENGVDLGALVVVRCEPTLAMLRAADHLLRSGAFGLVVLDRGADAAMPLPVQVRLTGLAKRHDAVLVQLQEKVSSDSLSSLRAVAVRQRVGEGLYRCTVQVVKDKRRGGTWECEQVLHGPMGLR